MTTTAVLRLFTRRRGDLLVVFTAALAAGTVELVLWHISARFSYLPGVLIVLAALHWGGARWGVVATLACLAAGSYVSEMLGSSGMPPAAHWVLAPTFVVIGVVLSVTYRRLRMDDLRRRRERRAFERALRHRDQLLRELRESTGRLKRLSESNIVGVIHWNLDTGLITDCNDEFLRMTGYDRTDLTSGRLDFNAMTPPDWRDRNAAGVEALRATGAAQAYEKEYLRKDGTRVPVIIAGARFHDSLREGMSFVLDLSGRRTGGGRSSSERTHVPGPRRFDRPARLDGAARRARVLVQPALV
ncbi:MAG: PAS domain S-box protein [Betaproteobacteria bacterium]|nr:PAS domain S-box protein [Betaproteobacteria bacterium]